MMILPSLAYGLGAAGLAWLGYKLLSKMIWRNLIFHWGVWPR